VNRASWVGGWTTRSVIARMLVDAVSRIHNRPGECAEGEEGGGDELEETRPNWPHPRDLAKDVNRARGVRSSTPT
jgi:hypothetical protein